MIDNRARQGHVCHEEASGMSDRNHGPAIPNCIAKESLIAAVIITLRLIVYATLSPNRFATGPPIESIWLMMRPIPFNILITVYFIIQCQISKW
jgi:hypothetical protein